MLYSSLLVKSRFIVSTCSVMYLLDGKKVWCGLNDIVSEGTFKWSDGSILTTQSFSQWEGSEPHDIGAEDCVQLVQRNNMYWNDVACSWQFISVCEMDIIV